MDGQEDKFQLKWPSVFSIPEVVAADEVPTRLNERKQLDGRGGQGE